MDQFPDISPAPGRYPFALGGGWTAVFLEPIPRYFALGLFRDGEPVELVDDDEDAREHLAGLTLRDASHARPHAGDRLRRQPAEPLPGRVDGGRELVPTPPAASSTGGQKRWTG
jgi:hypothetical protein